MKNHNDVRKMSKEVPCGTPKLTIERKEFCGNPKFVLLLSVYLPLIHAYSDVVA